MWESVKTPVRPQFIAFRSYHTTEDYSDHVVPVSRIVDIRAEKDEYSIVLFEPCTAKPTNGVVIHSINKESYDAILEQLGLSVG